MLKTASKIKGARIITGSKSPLQLSLRVVLILGISSFAIPLILLGIVLTMFGQVFSYVAIIGEQEIADGTVTIKNMTTGEQVKCTPEQAAEHIRKGLAERNGPLILEK